MTKAALGGKGLFGLRSQIPVHHGRQSGQGLKQSEAWRQAGADTEAVEGAARWLAQPASYRTSLGDHTRKRLGHLQKLLMFIT